MQSSTFLFVDFQGFLFLHFCCIWRGAYVRRNLKTRFRSAMRPPAYGNVADSLFIELSFIVSHFNQVIR